MLPLSLASADCAIVRLDEGYEGVSVPSKTYQMMAAGAAILAVEPAPDGAHRPRAGVLVRRADPAAKSNRTRPGHSSVL